MKLGDKLKAVKNLYSTFPVKENLLTSKKYYVIDNIDTDTFTIIDDTNHSRVFFKVEFNELFVNLTEDIESFIRHLEVSLKLNSDMSIKVYDYIIKNYKSFEMHYITTPDSFSTKQLVGISFDNAYYDIKIKVSEILQKLKDKYKSN